MKTLHIVAFILLVIGGLNWLLIGLGGFVTMGMGNWNVVHLVLGAWPPVEWLVYILVGLSAVYELWMHKKNCKTCSMSMPSSMPMQK